MRLKALHADAAESLKRGKLSRIRVGPTASPSVRGAKPALRSKSLAPWGPVRRLTCARCSSSGLASRMCSVAWCAEAPLSRPGHNRAHHHDEPNRTNCRCLSGAMARQGTIKALKTGCAFEKRQLESLPVLLNALAVFIPIAFDLLALRSAARTQPDRSASTLFDPRNCSRAPQTNPSATASHRPRRSPRRRSAWRPHQEQRRARLDRPRPRIPEVARSRRGRPRCPELMINPEARAAPLFRSDALRDPRRRTRFAILERGRASRSSKEDALRDPRRRTRFAILEGGRASRSSTGEIRKRLPPRGVSRRLSSAQIVGKPNRLLRWRPSTGPQLIMKITFILD
jgi:hypothetical protein